jgi:hypothetical protein
MTDQELEALIQHENENPGVHDEEWKAFNEARRREFEEWRVKQQPALVTGRKR